MSKFLTVFVFLAAAVVAGCTSLGGESSPQSFILRFEGEPDLKVLVYPDKEDCVVLALSTGGERRLQSAEWLTDSPPLICYRGRIIPVGDLPICMGEKKC